MRGRKRRNDIPTDEFENVVSLYKNKISLKQIAFDYDVTAYVVRDVLVGMGVEIGPRGRPWIHKMIPHTEGPDGEEHSYTLEQPSPLKHVDSVTTDRTQDDNAIDLGSWAEDIDKTATTDDDLLNLDMFRRPLGE